MLKDRLRNGRHESLETKPGAYGQPFSNGNVEAVGQGREKHAPMSKGVKVGLSPSQRRQNLTQNGSELC